MKENVARSGAGIPWLICLILLFFASIVGVVASARADFVAGFVLSIFSIAFIVFLMLGLYMVQPNQARVLQLFGAYRGSVKEPGLRWNNPLFTKQKVSLRTRNFETGRLKVNDSEGNPVEIGAVVVWRVYDSAEAVFNVEDFVNYVHVQSEAALRTLATNYPYVTHSEGAQSLSGNTAEISERLQVEVQERLEKAGIEVIETRISHLAYAQEIAAAMLQRQQASAVVAARSEIVEGAVGMVEHALEMLNQRQVVELDDERRAAMVSNLLVVLCSDRHTQPVVNTGNLYH
ncbi:MAG: SPFH domain-containing protein [Acidobacteriota bacterium]